MIPLIRFILAASVALAVTVQAAADHLRNLRVGDAVPAFELTTLDGTNTSSEALRGKAYVMVYLASEQAASEKALGAAHAIVAGFEELHGDQLAMIAVTAHTAHAAYFRDLLEQGSITAPFALDFDRKLYGDLGLIVLPTTIVVDSNGILRHVISGCMSDYEQVLRAEVEHTLGLIDDKQLEQRIGKRQFPRDRPSDKIARHRAAANVLKSNGMFVDAEKEIEAALQIDPGHIGALLDLAALHLTTDRLDDAEDIVTVILKNDPNQHRAKLLYGVLLYERDRYPEAERVLKEALLLNPDPAYAHYYLGLIYEKEGKADQAMEHYRKALVALLKNRTL
jgi:peroxiredoxin